MSIAVVILNYNGWEDTLECVESLQDQSHQDFRIIVVDNNSENDSYYHFIKWVNNEYLDDSEYVKNQKYINKRVYVEYSMEEALVGGDIQKEIFIKRKDPDKGFVFIKTDSNLGFSGGNNVGAKYAVLSGYDYVLLLNNDTVIIDKDFLKKLITPFETDERAFLTGPNIINFDATFDSPMVEDTFMSNLLYLPLRNILRRKLDCPSAYIDIKAISSPKPVPVFKISGACMMFKSDKLVDIEYLDENVWLSSEEAILSEKIKNKDGKIIFQPLTTLIHKKAKTPRPKSDKYSILKNHYKQRDYFNRNYRNYSALQLSLIGLMNKIRLILIRIGR